MNIKFYSYDGDPRVLFKTLTQQGTAAGYDCHVPADCNILQPHVKLAYEAAITGCNYAYIPDWGRYYTIETITGSPGSFMWIQLLSDPVLTWAQEIAGCDCTCVRNENIGPNMVVDTQYPAMQAAEYVTTTQFDSSDLDSMTGAGEYYYILTVK